MSLFNSKPKLITYMPSAVDVWYVDEPAYATIKGLVFPDQFQAIRYGELMMSRNNDIQAATFGDADFARPNVELIDDQIHIIRTGPIPLRPGCEWDPHVPYAQLGYF